MQKKCIPPVQKEKKAIFINHTSAAQTDSYTLLRAVTNTCTISQQISLPGTDQLLVNFFSTFLKINNFTGRDDLELGDISSSYQSSPSLYSAIIAVSALDLGTRCPDTQPRTRSKVIAIKAYRDSLVALQVELKNNLILQKTASLWSTFFLGVFEVSQHHNPVIHGEKADYK